MTDESSPWSYASYEAKYNETARLQTEVLPRNKVALFAALKAAGIAHISIEFEGSGDEGQIQDVIATGGGEAERAIPETTIEVEIVDFDKGAIAKRTVPANEYVETLAYKLLEGTHEGWENNDGAFGKFTFNVSEQTITLEYNERYVATEYSEHSV